MAPGDGVEAKQVAQGWRRKWVAKRKRGEEFWVKKREEKQKGRKLGCQKGNTEDSLFF